jgi:hypothetical protein
MIIEYGDGLKYEQGREREHQQKHHEHVRVSIIDVNAHVLVCEHRHRR